jgi:hypothetical protein
MPQIRWFQSQREGLGVESYLYSFMRIAGASRILQWGFDESTLDGVSCLNQWTLLQFPDEQSSGGEVAEGGVTIVTLECAGVLPNGESAEVVRHIEKSWARGHEAVEALRQAIGPEERDILCPLVEGGVSLHKLYSGMHDTCNGANLVATLMVKLQERKKRELTGDDVWDAMEPKTKACFDFLCGNHTKNLPIDRFNLLYTKWLESIIGPGMREAQSGAAV